MSSQITSNVFRDDANVLARVAQFGAGLFIPDWFPSCCWASLKSAWHSSNFSLNSLVPSCAVAGGHGHFVILITLWRFISFLWSTAGPIIILRTTARNCMRITRNTGRTRIALIATSSCGWIAQSLFQITAPSGVFVSSWKDVHWWNHYCKKSMVNSLSKASTSN